MPSGWIGDSISKTTGVIAAFRLRGNSRNDTDRSPEVIGHAQSLYHFAVL